MKIGREALELLGLYADGSTDRYDEDSGRFFFKKESPLRTWPEKFIFTALLT
jgi:hypothetical protein